MSTNIFSEIPATKYQENDFSIDTKEFIKVVESRRSVRVFENSSIPDEIMNSCFDLALLAPNSSNLQTWSFYWVRSKEKKDAIVKACLSQPAASTAAEIIVCVANIDSWKSNNKIMINTLEKLPHVPKQAIDYYKRLVPLAYTQGIFNILGFFKKILAFLIGLKKPMVREPTSRNQMITWASKSSSLACENLMLALRAYSFDSCPMEGFDSHRIKKALNLPKDSYITMVIGAGKRAPNGVYGPRIRFERTNFIHEV